ncbi:MAG: hypothetical protein DMF53_20185 [Acidobacteria bacterium]|nr:MAG: hypothetical protein DMF53_20185 [Acidobacteriota bacterium]
MPGKAALASVCVLTIVLALLVAGCGKDYRQVAVIDGDKAEIVTFGPVPKEPQKIWRPGRVLVFRTSSPVPGAPGNVSGKAGHVYRVSDDQKKLEEVAEFQHGVPNDTLAYTFGK